MKRLFNVAGISILLLGLTVPAPAATRQPTFLIFNPSADIAKESQYLESRGAVVRQIVPPQILVVEIPTNVSIGSIGSLLKRYVSAVPVAEVKPLGFMAEAAALQWNRDMVTQAHAAGSAGTMGFRALMAQQSLPSPTELVLEDKLNFIRCTWKGSAGALYYHVMMTRDEQFTDLVSESRSNRLESNLPLPSGSGPQTVYVRVRGVDRPDPNVPENDVYGNWSAPVSLTLSPHSVDSGRSAPTLTSPVNGYDSEGTTVFLEWTGSSADFSRVQLSKESNFASIYVDQIVPTREGFTPPSSAFHFGETFYWRVAEGGSTQSPWSPSRRFRVGVPRVDTVDTFINPEAPK